MRIDRAGNFGVGLKATNGGPDIMAATKKKTATKATARRGRKRAATAQCQEWEARRTIAERFGRACRC